MRYRQDIERKLSSCHIPTYCQKDGKLFRAALLKAASHHIPTGRRRLYTQQVPAEILAMKEKRDDLRKQDPESPRLSTINDEITKATSDHTRKQWREFVESIDHRTALNEFSQDRVPTTPACTWWSRPEEDPLSGKLDSTHPSRTSVKSDQGFLVSSQSCVSTLTHYSSELLLRRH